VARVINPADMTSRATDTALATAAALVATGLTAYGGEGLIAANVGGDSGWFATSIAYVPVLFIVAAILALLLTSVTDGFVAHSPDALRFARNTTAALGVIGALAAGNVQPSYFVAIGASAAGTVSLLALAINDRAKRRPAG